MLYPNLMTLQREGVPLTQGISTIKIFEYEKVLLLINYHKMQDAVSSVVIIEKKEKQQVGQIIYTRGTFR